MEIKINVSRIGEFNEKVLMLNKRIKKMHGIVDDVKVTFGSRSTVTLSTNSEFDPSEIIEVEIEVVKVNIESSFIGRDIKVNGWTLMAVADYSGSQSEAEFKIVNRISEDLRIRLAPRKAQVCDHCNRRVFRNKMIVVKNESGEEKAVGNSCVADFLGWGTPETILSLALLKRLGPDLESEFGGVRYSADDVVEDLVDYLCVAKYIISDNDGWALGNSTEKGVPTSEWISRAYGPDPKARYNARVLLRDHVTDADLLVVQAAINWSKAQAAGGNEFHRELSLYIRDGYVSRPQRSIAFWIVGSYMNMKKSQESQRPVLSEHYGAVKGKVDLTLELAFSTYFDGEWGRTYLYKFRDDVGRLFVVKTSNALGAPTEDRTAWRDAEAGDVYDVHARVMEHTVYNEVKETRIGYAKFNLIKKNVTKEESALEPQTGH